MLDKQHITETADSRKTLSSQIRKLLLRKRRALPRLACRHLLTRVVPRPHTLDLHAQVVSNLCPQGTTRQVFLFHPHLARPIPIPAQVLVSNRLRPSNVPHQSTLIQVNVCIRRKLRQLFAFSAPHRHYSATVPHKVLFA